jgi:uncharacterized protein (DUF362 family)
MIELGLEKLSGLNDSIRFLNSLFGSAKSIGMKVNLLGGHGASTHVEIAVLLSRLLADAGIKPNKHIIWDRSADELAANGYTIKMSGEGPLCFGTDSKGIGYSDELVSKGKIGGLLSKLLTEYCDTIINMPVLKDHGMAGITCAMKNYYGAIHNPNKYHGNACDPYIADLNSLEQIRSKEKLIIVDALKVQFHGGPSYHQRWSSNYGALLFGTDPVAIDTIGYEIIERMRKEAGIEAIKGSKREPKYLNTAASYGIGNTERSRIDLIEITA